MTRKHYRYSLARQDAKIAGVCAMMGDKFGIDPTIVRLAWIALPLLTPINFTTAIIAYAIVGVFLAVQRKRDVDGRGDVGAGRSEFERMGDTVRRKPTVHAMRTELDVNNRRMMAIDDHLVKQNDDLAREIEALREEK